jgi:hypothetical protein
MTILAEDDLEFDFSAAIEAVRFDNNAIHGQSTMKRVDFIAEYEDRFLFVEVKDPDNPAAVNSEAFKTKLFGGNLIPDLASKYRDSLWFRALSGKAGKPVHYIVLLSMASLDPALLLTKQDELHRCLPMNHKDWSISFAQACVILNLDQYKKQFGNHTVRRISAGA